MVICHVQIVEHRAHLGSIEKTIVIAAFSRLLKGCSHSEKVVPRHSGRLFNTPLVTDSET